MIRVFQKGFNFSQDGPGNRLVYHLQGCNLRCPWCSNPEGLGHDGGTEYTVSQIVEEVMQCRMMFFSGGGVTLTGGEVSLQLDEVSRLLSELHKAGIHTCVETNGLHPDTERLFSNLDLLIMDVKHHDTAIHRTVTGLDNTQVMENIRRALACGQALALRIPLIGGFNAEESDAHAFAALFCELGIQGKATVELLPYHEYGKDKYAALGLPYTVGEEARISKERLHTYKAILENKGIQIIQT